MSGDIPLPDENDFDLAPYWAGTREQEIRVQKCTDCDTLRWPPRPMCANCQSLNLTWVSTSGKGSLFSWTVVWHTTYSAYKEKIPFAVALIELDDAPARLVGHIINYPVEKLEIGLPVEVAFKETVDGVVLPKWRVANA